MEKAEVTNEIEIKRPTFNDDILVEIPKDMPKIKHNLNKLVDFSVALQNFYSKLVFNDENADEASKEKTRLNKLIDDVKRLRIDNVKEYKKPIEDFEKTAKEVEKNLEKAKESVQVFIDKAEEKRRKDKYTKVIEPIMNTLISNAFVNGYLIDKEKIIVDNRWYNKTFKDNDIEKDITNQINEIIRLEDEYNQGLEVIKSNLEAYNMLDSYDKYAERFNYTRNLTDILGDIKREKELTTVKGNTKVFSESVNLTSIDNSNMFDMPANFMFTVKFRGTNNQIEALRLYAKQLGMEEIN